MSGAGLPWEGGSAAPESGDAIGGLADPQTAEEQDLVRRLRAGEESAFEQLVRTQSGKLLGVARRFFRNEDDARDAVQDALVSAYRSISRFHGDARLSTWLHRITVNASLMKIRSASRHPETPIEDLLPHFDEGGHHADSVNEWPESAEDAVLKAETREQVRAAIDRLPEVARTVLLLRDIEELDTDEVAKILDITPNAVKIRLHRARQALRTLLDPVVVRGATRG